MKTISIDKVFKTLMIVIVVLVVATILTHIKDDQNLKKDEAFIREVFENVVDNFQGEHEGADAGASAGAGASANQNPDTELCNRYHGDIMGCIQSTDDKCEYDENARHCRPNDTETPCGKYNVYDYTGDVYDSQYSFINSAGRRTTTSTDNCDLNVPASLENYPSEQTNLQEAEIRILGNRISENKETIKNAVDVFIEREIAQNEQIDIERQEEITASQIVVNHQHYIDTLRHKIYKEIGAI